MAELSGGHFKILVLQPGPIPPSGGPLRERYLDYHGRRALERAAAAYAEAVSLLGAGAKSMPVLDFQLVESDPNRRRAIQREKRWQWISFREQIHESILIAVEPHIKASVHAAVDALNYLEDHELREDAHAAIHRAAFVNRGLFGCPIILRDGEYRTACPINISHLRIGVSAGLVSDMECSICGELIEDCDHQVGELYSKVATRTVEGTCSLCDSIACDHAEGQTFLVPAHGVARTITAAEISFVPRPRYPLARIVELTRDMGALHDDPRVIQAAQNGDLNCDCDLGPCKGFNEMRDWHLGEAVRIGVDECEEVDVL